METKTVSSTNFLTLGQWLLPVAFPRMYWHYDYEYILNLGTYTSISLKREYVFSCRARIHNMGIEPVSFIWR